jgi:hypothetical protein
MGMLYGLAFPSNYSKDSAMRISWTGANFLTRDSHTAIWDVKHYQQTGFYATAWHHWGDGSFHSSFYEYGTHPYPAANGSVDGTGQALTGTSTSGTVHFWELAGIGGHDYLCTAGGGGGTNISSSLGKWVTQARTCEVVSGTTVRHKFYPDLVNSPSLVITQDITTSDLASASPTTPAFSFGSSPWEDNAGGGTLFTDESTGGALRNIKLFNNIALTSTEILAEITSTTNKAVTPNGIANLWYANINPTPNDITDKSTAGHTPVWDTTARPGLYSEWVKVRQNCEMMLLSI